MDRKLETAFQPESPDCCWKCGRVGHHRQECTAQVPESQQRNVSRLCKRMQKQFEINQKPVSFKKVPSLQYYPVVALEIIVDIADTFHFDRIREVEDIGRPVLQPIQEIKYQKEQLHSINVQVINFQATDDDLIGTCKNRLLGTFTTDNEKENVARKVTDLELRRRDALNICNKMTMWAINAIGSASIFWTMEVQLKAWMDSLEWSGRPTLTEIMSQIKVCAEYGRKFVTMQREGRKLQNICHSSHVRDMMKLLYQIKSRLSSITRRFEQLEVNFKQKQLETAKAELLPMLESQQTARFRELEMKVACCLCQDEEKKWALRCGHVYCTECIEGLERPRRAEGYEVPGPFDPSRTLVTRSVDIASECAFCRGSIQNKIRIYL